jgi:hypothetical protein
MNTGIAGEGGTKRSKKSTVEYLPRQFFARNTRESAWLSNPGYQRSRSTLANASQNEVRRRNPRSAVAMAPDSNRMTRYDAS